MRIRLKGGPVARGLAPIIRYVHGALVFVAGAAQEVDDELGRILLNVRVRGKRIFEIAPDDAPVGKPVDTSGVPLDDVIVLEVEEEARPVRAPRGKRKKKKSDKEE